MPDEGVEPTSAGHGHRLIGIALLVTVGAAPLLAQVLHELSSVRWDTTLSSDYAGSENDVRALMHGNLRMGASSRLGVRNLGPAGSAWMTPFYAGTGQGAGGMILAAWAANLAGIATFVLVVRRAAGPVPALTAALVLAMALLRAGPASLSDFYNPALTVPAVLAATAACAALSLGRWAVLPVAVAGASLGVQLHLAAGPGLAVACALAVVGAVRAAGRPPTRPLVVAAVVACVLWSPTVIDQVTGTGNAAKLIEALVEGSDEHQPLGDPGPSPARPLRAAVALELSSLAAPDSALVGTLYTAFRPPDPSATRTALGGIALAAAISVAVLQRRRSPLGSRIVIFSAAGALATFAATATIRRGFLYYYLAPLPAYGVLITVGLALTATAGISWSGRRRVLWGAAASAVFALSYATTSNRVTEVVDTGAEGTVLALLVDQIQASVPPDCLKRGVALQADALQMSDVWALIVELDKRGISTSVPIELEALAGPGHRRSYREGMELQVPSLERLQAGGPFTLPMGHCD